MSELALVTSTCKNMSEARKLANSVLEARLAACVNIVPGIVSLYHWQNRIEEESEVYVIFKTRKTLASAIVSFIEKNHTYDVPMATVVPVTGQTEAYREWLKMETSNPDF